METMDNATGKVRSMINGIINHWCRKDHLGSKKTIALEEEEQKEEELEEGKEDKLEALGKKHMFFKKQ